MNYFPASGGGSNLKYYVDGVRKKLKGYKVYHVPPIKNLATEGGGNAATRTCVLNNLIHCVGISVHQAVDRSGNVTFFNPLPRNLEYGDQVCVFNGKLYLFITWRTDSNSYYQTTIYVWNEGTDTWTELETISSTTTSKHTTSVGVANGVLYVIPPFGTDMYKFNESAPHFTKIGTVPVNADYRKQMVDIDGKIGVLSYTSSSNPTSGDLYYLDNDTWSSVRLNKVPKRGENIIYIDNVPCFVTTGKSVATKSIYGITLNGIVEKEVIENFAFDLPVILDGKIHGFKSENTNAGYTHIVYDDGKGYFQTDRYMPVMIPIFE